MCAILADLVNRHFWRNPMKPTDGVAAKDKGHVMDDGRTPAGACACPHINRNDQRCGNRFTLTRLDQAFTVCMGSFNACPMYHRINSELATGRAKRPSRVPIVTITANGRTAALRPTGT